MSAVGIVLIVDGQLLAEHFADHLEQIPDPHGLVAGNDDVLILEFRGQHRQGGRGGVVHVHVFAQGRGRAVIGDRARGQGFVDKAVDGVAPVRARAVERAVAQYGIRQLVHGLVVLDINLAGLLAATVKAAGFAVDIEGRGEDVTPDPLPAAGLKDHDVAQDVDPRRVHRAVVGLADVRDARVVEDHVRAFHAPAHGFFVQDIAGQHGLVRTQPGRGMQIHNGHRVPGLGELVADMRAQKAGTAENSYFHS